MSYSIHFKYYAKKKATYLTTEQQYSFPHLNRLKTFKNFVQFTEARNSFTYEHPRSKLLHHRYIIKMCISRT